MRPDRRRRPRSSGPRSTSRTLPVSLVGASALAKATLLMNDDAKQAMHFVDIARLEVAGNTDRGSGGQARHRDRCQARRCPKTSSSSPSATLRASPARCMRKRFGIASPNSTSPSPSRARSAGAQAGRDPGACSPTTTGARSSSRSHGSPSSTARSRSENPPRKMLRRCRGRGRSRCGARSSIGRRRLPLASRWQDSLWLDLASTEDLPQRDRELLGAVLAVVDEIQRWPKVVGDEEPSPVEELGRDFARRHTGAGLRRRRARAQDCGARREASAVRCGKLRMRR